MAGTTSRKALTSAAAGLFNSWARPAERVPNAAIFSRPRIKDSSPRVRSCIVRKILRSNPRHSWSRVRKSQQLIWYSEQFVTVRMETRIGASVITGISPKNAGALCCPMGMSTPSLRRVMLTWPLINRKKPLGSDPSSTTRVPGGRCSSLARSQAHSSRSVGNS